MKEPDYDNYTLEQLLDVHKNIDRESYPERFQRIEKILNDPEKLEALKLAQSKVDEVKRQEEEKEKVAFNGLALLIYGALVMFFGIAITRYGVNLSIESLPLRVTFGCILLYAGYRYLKKHLGKN